MMLWRGDMIWTRSRAAIVIADQVGDFADAVKALFGIFSRLLLLTLVATPMEQARRPCGRPSRHLRPDNHGLNLHRCVIRRRQSFGWFG